jgi:hypothetical protein
MIVEFAPKTPRGMVRHGGEVDMDDSAGRRLEAAEIAEINARHLITTPLRTADLLFVFGTRRDEVLRAETGCRLWHEKLFRFAIVSGGVTPGSHLSECAVIKP